MGKANLRVGIVGAGMGGLAAAAALRRSGIDVEVFEQARSFSRVGAGIHVAPNATRVLLGLGLPEEVMRQRAYFPELSRNREADTGEMTAELELGDRATEEYGAPYFFWHRGDLHETLTQLVPPDVVHRSKELVDVEVGEGPARLSFSDGTQVGVDVVVAADGVHSVVRDTLLGESTPDFTGRIAYRAVIPVERVAGLDLDPACKWWGSDRHFVHYYVSAGRELVFTTSVPDSEWDAESWSAEGDIDVLQEAFSGFHPQVRAILAEVDTVHRWAIHTREPLDSWSMGNAVLLGDACHTMTPYMGLGAAMAMEDAVILARCLEEVGEDSGEISSALKRYELTRKARTSQVQAISQSNRWGRYSRDAGWAYGYDAWTAPLAGSSAVSAA